MATVIMVCYSAPPTPGAAGLGAVARRSSLAGAGVVSSTVVACEFVSELFGGHVSSIKAILSTMFHQ